MRVKSLPVLVYELSRVRRGFYKTLRAVEELEEMGAPVLPVSPRESFLRSLDPQVRKLVITITIKILTKPALLGCMKKRDMHSDMITRLDS